ncbi:hypothetical protein F4009_21345 [Candidatus Poribacteria bacterium]|nr:hypothetical protein [Candidatus Poribacteria bacterium]MYH79849.1 hypothetical protein [Candidatus Poribacteria bacterium]MYK96508.1 hypothetical protein [Candidatus Poribacteria bacterium]
MAEESEQGALVSAAANEVSAPIETSDQESEQPAPIEAITAPESEASSDQAEEVITPESEASSEQKEAAETPPLLDAKQISWDLTPVEQELEVGDWISIEGYQDDLIGATVAEHAATRVLKWNDSSALYGTNGMVDIVSQATGLPAPDDRIVSVVGLVENPREDETVVQINKALLREQTVLIRATGQIDHISGDKSPKRWIVFLKKGVYVDFTGHQNGSQ